MMCGSSLLRISTKDRWCMYIYLIGPHFGSAVISFSFVLFLWEWGLKTLNVTVEVICSCSISTHTRFPHYSLNFYGRPKLMIGANFEIQVSCKDELKVAELDKIISHHKKIFCPSVDKIYHSTYSHFEFVL